MANVIAGGTHQRQERYADTIVKLFRKDLVVRSEFSRDYEGSPVSGSVNVPVRATDVAVGDYNVKTGGALTASATTYLPILITKDKYVNEIIDGYEAESVPDNIRAQRIESASYSIGTALETNAINELIASGTVETLKTALTNANAYKSIKDSVMAVKKNGVKVNEIVVIINSDTEGLLLEDEKFSNTAGTLGAELIRSGVVGKIAGAIVKTSDNLPAKTEYLVFAKPWAQAIDEWKVEPTINNLTNDYIGSSALQGRFIYEDKLTNALACRIKTIA